MNKPKWTPGPWRVARSGTKDRSVIVEFENEDRWAWLCEVYREHEGEHDWRDLHADARLIAAAPLLYEALRDVLAVIGEGQRGRATWDVFDLHLDRVRAALAAAQEDGA